MFMTQHERKKGEPRCTMNKPVISPALSRGGNFGLKSRQRERLHKAEQMSWNAA
jgi:hypothetical protein